MMQQNGLETRRGSQGGFTVEVSFMQSRKRLVATGVIPNTFKMPAVPVGPPRQQEPG